MRGRVVLILELFLTSLVSNNINFSLYDFFRVMQFILTAWFFLLGFFSAWASPVMNFWEQNKHKTKQYKAILKDTLIMDMRANGLRKKRLFAKHSSGAFMPNPRVAAILSAVLPGAGQIYNRAYWKAPIVWGFVGWMGYLTLDNFMWYRKAGFAFLAKQKSDQGDHSLLPQVDPLLVRLSAVTVRGYRNKFRGDVDLYGLLLLVVWGLNVMEAAVHAHLKGFDVSPKLSLHTYPQLLSTPFARAYGWGISLNWHKPKFMGETPTNRSIFREPEPLL